MKWVRGIGGRNTNANALNQDSDPDDEVKNYQ
jgi:hypothetical protein